MMNFKSRIKSIQRILEIGEYTSAATACVNLIEQALQQVFSQSLERVDEEVRRKVWEAVQKRDRRGEGLKGLTMGQLIHILRESKFLDAWAQVSGKDLSGFQMINLDNLRALRNKLIHKGKDVTRAEAEILFDCLQIILETFEIGDKTPPSVSEPLMNFEKELTTFEKIATGQDTETQLIFVHGPGGIGKTRLLTEYKRIASENTLNMLSISLGPQISIESCLNQIVCHFSGSLAVQSL